MTLTTDPQATAGPGAPNGGAAGQMAEAVQPLFGGTLPVRLRAWDGSEAGPAGAPVVVVRDAAALRRLVFRPGELGLAQAYVTGEIDVEGDLLDGFRRVWQSVREDGASPRLNPTALAQGLRTAFRLGAIGVPPAPPASQARLRGRLHSAAPRPRRHLAPLRPLQRLLLADPRPAHGLLLRLLHQRRGRLHARGRPARQARPGLRASSDSPTPPRATATSTSAAAGARCRCTLPRSTASRSSASPSPQSRRPSSTRGSRSAGSRTASRSGSRTTATSPTAPSTRSPRSRWASTSARRTTRSSPAASTGCSRDGRACAGAADVARPPGPAAVPSSRRSSPPTCTCAPSARPSTCSSGPASRCATCTRCASTTCAPSTPGTPPSRTTGTARSRWSARRSRASGGSTWSAARWPSRRAAWASTRSWRSSPTAQRPQQACPPVQLDF